MPDKANPLVPLIDPGHSVALVGNSAGLNERSDGSLIDDHDVIIRVNDGIAAGFERNVGRRTSIRFFGARIQPRHHPFFSKLAENSILVTRAANERILAEIGYSGRIQSFRNHKSLAQEALPVLSRFVEIQKIPTEHPRSGIVVLSLLSPMFEKGLRLSVFGFDMESKVDGAGHYFRKKIRQATEISRDHGPLELEFDVLRRLQLGGFIRVHF